MVDITASQGSDIYATPESDLSRQPRSGRAGGNLEDAVSGNIEVNMLQTLGEAWRGMKGFKLKCHIATAIWFLVYILAAMISLPVSIGLVSLGASREITMIVSQLVQTVAIAATMPMMVGITIMGIRHSQGKPVSAGLIFNYFHRAAAAILWYLLMVLMIALGFVLLVLPGIYLSFAYMYSLPLMIEKDMGPWQALEASRRALTPIWFRVTGFMLLLWLLMILGMLPLGIPLIWIMPWVMLAYAMLYFKLFGAEPGTLED
jgi:hypothetical protein